MTAKTALELVEPAIAQRLSNLLTMWWLTITPHKHRADALITHSRKQLGRFESFMRHHFFQSSYYMNSMSYAPQDGTRILLQYNVRHFINGSYQKDGAKWEEVRWISDKNQTGSEAHWEPWCGNPRSRSTLHISPEDAIAWVPMPEVNK